MDEEKKTQGEKPEVPTGDKREGSEPQAATIVEQARAEREKLEAALKRQEALIQREEELEARRALGGNSPGAPQEAKKQVETEKEYAERVLKGKI